MTAIFGIHSLCDRPITRHDLELLDAQMTSWGADGGGLYQAASIGLGSRLSHVSEEDRAEQQPLVSAGQALVACARFDNRAALCGALALANGPEVPESALVLAAFQRWGVRCVEHLRGDWVFAVWDESRRRLVIARDATGDSGVYWWSDGRTFAFASSMRGLLALPSVPRRPDPRSVADLLTAFSDPARCSATVYDGIRRLPPGHLLTVDSREIRMRRWWRPERLSPIVLPDRDAYDAAFRELYDDAVAQRLRARGGVAAMLSGGLDSGSVVAMAAPRLVASGRVLRCYVHRPQFEAPEDTRRMADELGLASETARYVGNAEIVGVQTEHVSVLDGLERALVIHGAPSHGASNQFWMLDVLERARNDGARVLLTGQCGNATISYGGEGTLWPGLLQGNFADLRQAFRRDGPWRATRRHLLGPLARAAGVPAMLAALRNVPAAGAIHPQLAREARLSARMRRAALDSVLPGRSLQAGISGFRLGMHRGGAGAAEWMEKGAAYGLSVRDPTRDQRVVEFCWRVPDAVHWGDGQQRALIRRGMRHMLPAVVLRNPRRGLQSADLIRRLVPLRARVDAVLSALEADPLARDWLNLPWLRSVHARVHHHAHTELLRRDVALFVRGLGVGLFLSGHATASPDFAMTARARGQGRTEG